MAKITVSDLAQHLAQALDASAAAPAEGELLQTARRDLAKHVDDTRVAAQLKTGLSLLGAQQRLSAAGVALLTWLVQAYPGRGGQRGMGLTRL